MSPARCGTISMMTADEIASAPDMVSPLTLPTPWKGWYATQ
ncbi:hypothetical protein O1M54_10810 [Streptomyces diastatochromogenes]|nr:hypothetical protein [Streptomyces diastatochromogenes]